MFSSLWVSDGGIARQCVELVLAAAVGVLLYYLPLRLLRWQGSARALTLLEPTAKAAAAGLLLYSCLGMVQPHLPSVLPTRLAGPPPPDALYFLGGVAVGGGLVLQVSLHFGDAGPNAATAAMLAHCVAEGAGLGLLVGSPGFPAIFRSQVLHGVPDGALMAMVSLERSGLLRAVCFALLARLAQAVAYYATAAYIPSVSAGTAQFAEGVALGSMAAMTWEELAKPARGTLGDKRTILTVSAAAVASYIILE
ncbi:uncharacterized protein Tco025E_08624 [Trypanosoma conorhini]|uniref:Uncharacterized protein n=1 Tax=Trypanosoma conorhini TaxID=83891 RepID=A0A422N719_9TRYP|nr:uncharacterized protein Tco025E_08624 [Trypanosoma conorhini]RNF01277.1 hypothetical protein Tco025E_08624 [Trypanosoma conorhini]